jgi:uncharacterized protein (TIGR00156 family)
MSAHTFMPSHGALMAALAVVAACAIADPAQAQYAGPTELQAGKVSAVLQDPKDDENVVLQGHLLRQLGDEKYQFSDGTGEIVVEIDDDDLPKEAIDEKTRVELRGEVDTGRDRPPEIEVDEVRVLK